MPCLQDSEARSERVGGPSNQRLRWASQWLYTRRISPPDAIDPWTGGKHPRRVRVEAPRIEGDQRRRRVHGIQLDQESVAVGQLPDHLRRVDGRDEERLRVSRFDGRPLLRGVRVETHAEGVQTIAVVDIRRSATTR